MASEDRHPPTPTKLPRARKVERAIVEQLDEAEHSLVLSRSQVRGALRGVGVGAAIGALMGMLLALVPVDGVEFLWRASLLLGIGAFGGAVAGFVIGGGRGPVDEGSAPEVFARTHPG